MAMLDDHHVVMVMMPAVVAMHIAVMAASDHNGFSTGDRRRRDGNGGKCGNHVSKLLHVVLLILIEG